MKMTKIQRDTINAKKEVFRGYGITDKFLYECANRSEHDPRLYHP